MKKSEIREKLAKALPYPELSEEARQRIVSVCRALPERQEAAGETVIRGPWGQEAVWEEATEERHRKAFLALKAVGGLAAAFLVCVGVFTVMRLSSPSTMAGGPDGGAPAQGVNSEAGVLDGQEYGKPAGNFDHEVPRTEESETWASSEAPGNRISGEERRRAMFGYPEFDTEFQWVEVDSKSGAVKPAVGFRFTLPPDMVESDFCYVQLLWDDRPIREIQLGRERYEEWEWYKEDELSAQESWEVATETWRLTADKKEDGWRYQVLVIPSAEEYDGLLDGRLILDPEAPRTNGKWRTNGRWRIMAKEKEVPLYDSIMDYDYEASYGEDAPSEVQNGGEDDQGALAAPYTTQPTEPEEALGAVSSTPEDYQGEEEASSRVPAYSSATPVPGKVFGAVSSTPGDYQGG